MNVQGRIEGAERTGFAAQMVAVARAALPMGAAELSQMGMGVTDSMLVGRLGHEALAVAALSTTLYFTLTGIVEAGLGAGGVMIARAFGAGRSRDIGAIHTMTVMVGVLLCLPCLVLLYNAQWLLGLMGEPPAVAVQCGEFLRVLMWSVVPYVVGLGVAREVLPAIHAQRMLLIVMPSALVLNGLLNAGLIFGLCGLPRMGLWGSAVATMLTGWGSAAVLYGGALMQARVRHLLVPLRWKPDLVLPLLRFGLPMCVTSAAEIAMFMACGLRAGLFGTEALAAHGIALNVTAMTFMVSLSIGQATNMRVGHMLGAGVALAARRAARAGLVLVSGYSIVTAVLLLLFAHQIVGLYLDAGTAGNAATVHLAAELLVIAAFYQLFDGLQVVQVSILRGFGDSFIPMLIAAAGYWGIGFPAGGWLGFDRGWGVHGLWWGLAAGLISVSVMLGVRLVPFMRGPGVPLRSGGAVH